MACPRCGVATSGDGLCSACAAAPSAAPPSTGADEPPPVPSPDDFVGRMIPAGNKPALVAYYVSLLSLLPLLGVVAGTVAVVYGVRGVRLARRHPEVRGGAHAWFGLLFGGFFALVWLVGGVVLIVAAASHR